MRGFLTPETDAPSRLDVPDTNERYRRTFLLIRAVIGALGIALPIVVVLVGRGLADDGPFLVRSSISGYYYSGARDLFVGILSALAVFLVTYKVMTARLDNTLSTVAGLAFLLVAIFPTGKPTEDTPLTPLQERLGEAAVQAIHFGAAVASIGLLGVICFLFGIREGKRSPRAGKRSPMFWRRYHYTCAGIIAAAIFFIIVTGFAGGPPKALLVGEAVAVWAFSASWLLKGLELDVLFPTPHS